MDPQDIADSAFGDEGDSAPPPDKGAGGRPELVALVRKLGRALDAKDWEGAAGAFSDAVEAADVDDGP